MKAKAVALILYKFALNTKDIFLNANSFIPDTKAFVFMAYSAVLIKKITIITAKLIAVIEREIILNERNYSSETC
jgi:hypothetical protein